MVKIMKKKWIMICTLLFFIAAVLGGIKLYRIHLRDQSGILLAFDDYQAPSWRDHFDYFDENGVKVTFFINATEPTDFCYEAIERGHEIAYHGKEHAIMKYCTEQELFELAIEPIDVFREKGIELTTFAYPYGEYSSETNEILLQHYAVLRGAFSYELNPKHNLRHGFVESLSIDNINYESQKAFEERITTILNEAKSVKGTVVSLYSHAIGDGAWCVNEEKLEFLITKAQELGLQFYTFKELQEN